MQSRVGEAAVCADSSQKRIHREMNMDRPEAFWDFFDKFYCISLKERVDRRREALIQFERVGLKSRVEFVLADKHAADCEEGIYRSHLECLKKGLHAGADRIVIFEDDIQFQRFHPEKLKLCVDFLSSNINWNMFFFGCLISGSKRIRNKSILKVKYRSLAHAYVINRRFAETVAETPWRNVSFDALLNSIQQDFYAVYPSFAFQSSSATDNEKYIRLDKFRRLCGGLCRVQKRNEFYHYHKPAIVAVHILIVLLIALLIL